MNVSRSRLIAAIIVNAAVFAFEVWAIFFGIRKNGLAGNFMYYTELSNLLGGIVCAVCAVAELRALRRGAEGAGVKRAANTPAFETTSESEPEGELFPGVSRTLSWVKFAASSCLLMTLFVVLFVLTPMLENAGYPGFYLMFADGAKPVTHLCAPLAVTLSYILFEADRTMTLKQSLVGFAPTLAYAAVAYPCNILCVWDGPYPFFQVWTMPIWMSMLWFAALFVLAYSLCQIPRLLARRLRAR